MEKPTDHITPDDVKRKKEALKNGIIFVTAAYAGALTASLTQPSQLSEKKWESRFEICDIHNLPIDETRQKLRKQAEELFLNYTKVIPLSVAEDGGDAKIRERKICTEGIETTCQPCMEVWIAKEKF